MATVLILLNSSKVQRYITDTVISVFEEKTGGHLSIGRLRLRIPNTISISDIKLSDPDNEKIASIRQANAHINLLPLLRGRINITHVGVDSLDAHIAMSADSVMNIQFLIDAFTPQGEVTTPDLDFPQMTLTGAQFRYSDFTKPLSVTPGIFNPADIFVSDIDTELSLSVLNGSDISAAIMYLNLREQSGFVVDNISARLHSNDSSIVLHNLVVALPQTYIHMDSAVMHQLTNDDEIVWDNTTVNMAITDAQIHLPDFQAFAPQLRGLTGKTLVTAHVSGKMSNVRITDLHASYGDVLSIQANMDINGLPEYDKAFFYCNIDHITFDKASVQDIAAKVTGRPVLIPDDFANLGKCRYSGNISGFLSNMVLYGSLRTDIGSIKTDVSVQATKDLQQFKINGRVSTDNLRLHRILPESGLGDVGFASNAKVTIGRNNDIVADAKLNIKHITYRDYRYRNIRINGMFKPHLFTGHILMDDPNGYLDFDGMLSDINDYHNCEFTLRLDHFRPNLLNLIEDYPHLDISLSTAADFEGEQWANLSGFISLDSLQILNGENKAYILPHLMLEALTSDTSSATITSDLINGSIHGRYALAALPSSIMSLVSETMPLAAHLKIPKTKRVDNDITFMIDIEPLKPLLSTLDIPWYTTRTTNIYGYLNTDSRLMETTVNIPCISNGTTSIDSIVFELDNRESINANLSLSTGMKNGRLNANLGISAYSDTIETTLEWDNHRDIQRLAGEIATVTAFGMKPKTDSLTVNMSILPTELILQDKRWTMNAGSVYTDILNTIINNVGLHSEDNQMIAIDGIISDNKDEEINVALKDISLDNISDLLPEETAVTFGGRVSGSASVSQLRDIPRITADVRSERFMFNEAYFGAVDATCRFDNTTTSLVFGGDVTADDGSRTAHIDGSYCFPLDSLDLKGKADGLDIRFINYYTAPVFGRVAGTAYGDVHVYGITKSKKVAVDVDALAKDASITIDFLKNTFYFTDSIHLDRSIFDFGTIELTDRYGNRGTLSGSIHHDYFLNFIIDLNVNVDNMLVLNTTKADSEDFYGTAYATGNVRLSGDEKTMKITCKAQTESGTSIYIPIDNYTAGENSFITFIDHSMKDSTDTDTPADVKQSATNLLLDIMVDVTPAANVQLLIDSKSGDMLRANGSGSLRITFDINSNDIKLYGTYQIEQGSYLFSFQNLLRKEFKIREGSSIAWTGDPLNAAIDINAYYQLTADLAEILDETILSNTGRTSVPVQCLLTLSGILTQPTIKFNMRLPNSDEELNRALLNTVNTEEQMNRQIVSLLILGKFLNNEQMGTNTVFSQNELFSVVSSTLSSQLNNWASQMFDNWGFGVNFRTTGEGETRSNEYEFNFQYSPTKRWEITGNVGYRDDNMSSNPFIGDFDVTYKLIESGKLQAKAYTHTNDYREFKKGLTTQGVGLVYSENFNSIPELVQSWKTNAEKAKKARAIRREARKAKREAKKAEKEDRKAQKQQKNTPTDAIQ